MAKIMIVEDEGLVALQIKEALEQMGYIIPAVLDSGEACIQEMFRVKPDLVLMDIRLKGNMDGIQSAKFIRENFFVPVIFLTAHSDEKTLQSARLAEAYGYVLKPFEDKALKASIEVALFKADKERVLRDNNEWFSLVFRSTGEAVLIADLNGVIRYSNELATEITGWSSVELYGHRLADMFHTFDSSSRSPHPPVFKTTLSDGSILNFHNVALKIKEGKEVAVDYTIAPLKNNPTCMAGVIIVFRESGVYSSAENTIKVDMDSPLRIQRDFLPAKEGMVQGVKTDFLFIPCLFGSGDIFNYFALDNDHIGFYLLDVMGHGFSAALFAIALYHVLLPDIQSGGILKETPREQRAGGLPAYIISPAVVIRKLNERFFFRKNAHPFFTIVYGVLDKKNSRCFLARGGHTPPLLQRQGNITAVTGLEGPAIGIMPEIDVIEKEISLARGDRLFLYSDGLVEAKDENGRSYGIQRLQALLEAGRGNDLPALSARLEKEIAGWRDIRIFDDDIAFLALEIE